jgi:hypothetical protein
MADYSDLIARLEKAEGPDREIDVDILIAFGWSRDGRHMGEPRWVRPNGQQTAFNALFGPVYHLTSSLDEVIRLVSRELPGWTMAADATVPGAGIDYSLYSPTDPDGTQPTAKGGVRADSIGDVSAHARALLIAALSALQSLEQKEAA